MEDLIGRQLEEVLVKSLVKRPEAQHATASDFASALLEVTWRGNEAQLK